MGRTRKYKRYSPEFKREALKRASEDGTTDKQVCEDLGNLRYCQAVYKLITEKKR